MKARSEASRQNLFSFLKFIFNINLQAPGTAFGPDMMIPLMLMGNTDNNQELMFFMMTQMNNKACDADPYYAIH